MSEEKKCLYRIETSHWYIERTIYAVAGTFVLGSALLAFFVHINWIYFTMLIGVMLIGFSLTGYCPMAIIINKCGIKKK